MVAKEKKLTIRLTAVQRGYVAEMAGTENMSVAIRLLINAHMNQANSRKVKP
jgi:hypothetical protein